MMSKYLRLTMHYAKGDNHVWNRRGEVTENITGADQDTENNAALPYTKHRN